MTQNQNPNQNPNPNDAPNQDSNVNEQQYPVALDLFEQFARVEWLMHRFHQRNRRAHGPMGDPHRGQGRILSLLKIQPEISQRDLSYLLDMRPQSLGELLTKLEKGGFIERTAARDDRRAMNIRLTPAGEEAADANQRPSRADSMFTCLTDEERATLGSYLERIIGSLEEQIGDQPEPYPPHWREGGYPRFSPEQIEQFRAMGHKFGHRWPGGFPGPDEFHGHGPDGCRRPGPDGFRGPGRGGFPGAPLNEFARGESRELKHPSKDSTEE